MSLGLRWWGYGYLIVGKSLSISFWSSLKIINRSFHSKIGKRAYDLDLILLESASKHYLRINRERRFDHHL